MGQLDKPTLEVLAQVPEVLRALVEENTKLASALEEYKRVGQAEEIVSMMEARGFADESVPFKQKVAALLASKKDLGVVKEALALSAPDLSFASVSDMSDETDSTSALENFILGN